RWAAAVHRGDLDAVLADHAEDIVMYDVPPPHEGLHGLAAYRATWPPFFQWQARGACFDIETLDVTAGTDVAYAHALLRCGTPEELAEHPTLRLRKERDAGWWRTNTTRSRTTDGPTGSRAPYGRFPRAPFW